ncbi:MAG: lipoyl(octanoyl) transferase LipB [Myxococcota bacterium]
MGHPVEVIELGLVPYAEGLDLQERAIEERRAGDRGDVLFLLEHPPVVTLGRGSRPENLLVSREELAARGVGLFEARRGGDVTYHAPGQLVGYPVLDLEARGQPDLHAHLRRLEAVLCDALRSLGVPPRTVPGRTGVFVDDPEPAAAPRKIASIGVGARGWVTSHGFALNVDLDLAGFGCIVPCGLDDVAMTSVVAELGSDARPDLPARTRAAVRSAFARHFG